MEYTGRPLHIIARIHTDFPTKFGIPRQSGLIDELKAEIVFEPDDKMVNALNVRISENDTAEF